MARRAQSNVTDFLTNFNAAFGLTQKVGEAWQSAKLANAQEEDEPSQYTTEQSQQITELAQAKDENGNPYYTLDAKPDGSYDLKSNFAYKGADGQQVDAGSTATTFTPQASGKVKYIGQTYDKASFTPEVKRMAQARAQADLKTKFDAEAGAAMHAKLNDAEQSKQLFDTKMGIYNRQTKQLDADEAYQTGLQQLHSQSIYGQKIAQYTSNMQAWQTQVDERNKRLAQGESVESVPPVQEMPKPPSYSEADQISDWGRRLDYQLRHGKAEQRDLALYADTIKKTQDSGYIEALRLAQSGAELESVLDVLNKKSGMNIPPDAVIGYDVRPSNGTTPGTTIITYMDENGQQRSIDALATLDSLNQAGDWFTRQQQTVTAQRLQEKEDRMMQLLLNPGLSGGGTASRSSAGKAGARPQTPLEQTQQLISHTAEKIGESGNKLSPEETLNANSYAVTLHNLNPSNVPPADMARAALYLAKTPGALETAPVTLNPNSGQLVHTLPNQLTNGRDIVISDKVDTDSYLGTLDRSQRSALLQNVTSSIQGIAGISPEQVQAAMRDKNIAKALMSGASQAAANQLRQQYQGTNIPEAQINRVVQQNNARIANLLVLASKLGN